MPDPFLDTIERALAASGPSEELLARLAERLATHSGTIHLLDAQGLLQLRASLNIPSPVLPVIRTIPVGKGMAGLAALRRVPVSACNLQTDASGDVRPGAKATGMQGSIVVPILSGAEVIGTLGVASPNERTYTPEETELLLEVGRRIAGQVARAPGGALNPSR